jgi:hypothetical protein
MFYNIKSEKKNRLILFFVCISATTQPLRVIILKSPDFINHLPKALCLPQTLNKFLNFVRIYGKKLIGDENLAIFADIRDKEIWHK